MDNDYSKEELKLLTTINFMKYGYIHQLERKFGVSLVHDSEILGWIRVYNDKWIITHSALKLYSELYKETWLDRIKSWIISFYVWLKTGL